MRVSPLELQFERWELAIARLTAEMTACAQCDWESLRHTAGVAIRERRGVRSKLGAVAILYHGFEVGLYRDFECRGVAKESLRAHRSGGKQ